MAKQRIQRIERKLTAEERRRHARIRAAAEKDFPPKAVDRPTPPLGIPAAIHAARKAQGLTWYALAQRAGVPNQATVRDIEQGKEVRVSNLRAVAQALGLELELVPAGEAEAEIHEGDSDEEREKNDATRWLLGGQRVAEIL